MTLAFVSSLKVKVCVQCIPPVFTQCGRIPSDRKVKGKTITLFSTLNGSLSLPSPVGLGDE